MISILFGLTSALTWGAGDFTGGLAARRTGAYRAVFYGEAIGLLLLLMAVVATPQPLPDAKSILLSIAAGGLGTTGLLLLYSAMAQGKMSIAGPVSALLAAALPVIVGMITDGFPGYLTFLGFGLALAAIWLVSQSEDGVKDIFTHLSDLRLPLLAGVRLWLILYPDERRHTRGNFVADGLFARCRIAGYGIVHYRSPRFIRHRPRGMAGDDSEWHSRRERELLLYPRRTNRPARYFGGAQLVVSRFDRYTRLDHLEGTLDAHAVARHPVCIDRDYSFYNLRILHHGVHGVRRQN